MIVGNVGMASVFQAKVLVYVDLKANILATVPPNPIAVGFSIDSPPIGKKWFIYTNSNWYEFPLSSDNRTLQDMGYTQDSAISGYGDDYITDKLIANSVIGSNTRAVNGAIRVNQDPTPDELEIYMRSSGWFDILYDLTYATGEFTHTPLETLIRVWSGHSVAVGLNGLPIIQEYQGSIGAYPSEPVIDGGSF